MLEVGSCSSLLLRNVEGWSCSMLKMFGHVVVLLLRNVEGRSCSKVSCCLRNVEVWSCSSFVVKKC